MESSQIRRDSSTDPGPDPRGTPDRPPAYGPYGEHDERFEDTPPGIQVRRGGPQSADYVIWHRPMRRFAVVSSSGLDFVAEGSELTLDHVVRWLVNNGREAPEPDENLGMDYETTIWEGARLAAIVTRRDGQVPLVQRFEQPPGTYPAPASLGYAPPWERREGGHDA